MTQVVEYLPIKGEALNLNSSTSRKKEKNLLEQSAGGNTSL
jgi:hypothetical protein